MQNMRLSRAVVILILSPSLTKDTSIELQTALTLNRPGGILPVPGLYFITSKIVQLAKKAKNADISVLSNFLAIFFKFFLYIEKFYQVLSTCQISDQLDHSNRNYRLGAESALPQPYQSAKSLACLRLTYVSVQNTIRCLCWTGKLSSLHDVEFAKSTGYVLGIHEAKKNFSLYMIDF